MHNLITEVQLQLLAKTLGVAPAEVDAFEGLGAEKIQALRELASGYLFDELAPIFGRVSNLAPLVPDALVTKVAEMAVPPLVAGRASGALGVAHPHRINAILRRLSPEYTADSAQSIDPRVIPLVSAGLDIPLLIPAARILLARKDFATVTLLISSVDNDRLFTELVEAISADGQHLGTILQALSYAPSDTWLTENLGRLRRPLLRKLFSPTADTETVAALSVIARLGSDLRPQVAEHLFDSLDTTGVRALADTAHTHGADAELRSFADALGDGRREQFDRLVVTEVAE
ncbi:MAG: hypothetical protein JWN03_3131 [Nocardia sp.]|uniref:hypothetical protein n=1 Tax=Nocardia sp. TaxID=1821 RepID=UPI00262D88F7|nr:hypothetical protein [Nocardia sp.]MCU1642856.1 hypothetical protein [Nocardia sp.]